MAQLKSSSVLFSVVSLGIDSHRLGSAKAASDNGLPFAEPSKYHEVYATLLERQLLASGSREKGYVHLLWTPGMLRFGSRQARRLSPLLSIRVPAIIGNQGAYVTSGSRCVHSMIHQRCTDIYISRLFQVPVLQCSSVLLLKGSSWR